MTRLASTFLLSATLLALAANPAFALDGGTLRLNTDNGWRAFEVISQSDNPGGDGYSYAMPGTFDGAGAYMVDGSTLRVQTNHETGDASVSEVDLDLGNLQAAIASMISTGSTGGFNFVLAARQAYGRVSYNGGGSWTSTSNTGNTSFYRFCSSQAYAPDTFGQDRGFVDHIYITGEETSGGALFALDSIARDFYQLSGVTGSAPGGIGGMPFDAWENAALLDTGETDHVALLLSPDGGTQRLMLYIGEKGKNTSGGTSNSFLARNGLAYGSWYYLNSSLPGSVGSTNNGSFDATSSGALAASKVEDVDTFPGEPTRIVLGNQNYGAFTFDFDLSFGTGFNAGASSFTVTMIDGSGGSCNSHDNVDWTAPTTLGGTSHPEGLVFVNEDNSSGEIWVMRPNGSGQTRVGSTTVGAESTGIFDLSEFVGYAPGSVMMTNNQGSPSSMSVLINPDATPTSSGCGNSTCDVGEDADSCPQDCPDLCDDGYCSAAEDSSTCPEDCGSFCGDGVCNGGENGSNCADDCGACIAVGDGLGCNSSTPCCSGTGNCTGGKPSNRVYAPAASVCGDGVVEGAEDCEAGVPLSGSCQTLGYSGGSLSCSACSYDASACTGGSCAGNKAACSVNSDCCSNNCKNGACKGN